MRLVPYPAKNVRREQRECSSPVVDMATLHDLRGLDDGCMPRQCRDFEVRHCPGRVALTRGLRWVFCSRQHKHKGRSEPSRVGGRFGWAGTVRPVGLPWLSAEPSGLASRSPRLAESFTVVASDLREYGDSGKPCGEVLLHPARRPARANDRRRTGSAAGPPARQEPDLGSSTWPHWRSIGDVLSIPRPSKGLRGVPGTSRDRSVTGRLGRRARPQDRVSASRSGGAGGGSHCDPMAAWRQVADQVAGVALPLGLSLANKRRRELRRR